MGDFYNTTRGPLSATLNNGAPLSIGPKKWVFIPAEHENSSSIVLLLKKGHLKRSKVPLTEVAAPTPAVLAVQVPIPVDAVPVSFEVEAVAPIPDPAPSSPVTASAKEDVSKKKK